MRLKTLIVLFKIFTKLINRTKIRYHQSVRCDIHFLLGAAFLAGLLAAFLVDLLAAAFCGVAWAEPAAGACWAAWAGAAFLVTLLATFLPAGLLAILLEAVFLATFLVAGLLTPVLAIKERDEYLHEWTNWSNSVICNSTAYPHCTVKSQHPHTCYSDRQCKQVHIRMR